MAPPKPRIRREEMGAHTWHPLGPQEEEPRGTSVGLGILLFVVVGLLLVARLGLLVLYIPAAPQAPSPSPAPQALSVRTSTIEATATPCPPTPTATATEPPTPSPTATPAILRLAVEQQAYAPYRTLFAGLAQRYEHLQIIPYTRTVPLDDTLAAQAHDGAIFWSAQPPAEAILLRTEPYAVIVHHSFPRDSVSWAQLRAMVEGKDQTYRLITVDEGQLAGELVGLEGAAKAPQERVADWPAVKEYVATHQDAWALVPWDVVDFRVRTLKIEGQRCDPRHLADYPLGRRLWLAGAGIWPPQLVEDLGAALSYAPPATLELVAVGDIMLDRTLKERMRTLAVRYPFEGAGIQPILAGADIAFGNLEAPIADRGTRVAKTYTFRADPQAVEALVYAGLDVLSLANNHSGDFGTEALLQTLALLRQAEILAVGAGETITQAHEAKIITRNGLQVAFLAYNQVPPESFAATATRPGHATMERERMIADVQAARQRADLVIVSCHWGVEYTPYATATQRELGRALAQAGADLVIGHHPHVVQGLAFERDTLVAYSLGNFVFDMDLQTPTMEGVILRCLLDVSGVKTLELLPCRLVDGRPVLASAEEGAPILERIWRVTREQNGLPQSTITATPAGTPTHPQ
jgi:poly-gamma-glutamate capsule biosynthesis protein CapA/YwtB (metallophosphatase superfamily)